MLSMSVLMKAQNPLMVVTVVLMEHCSTSYDQLVLVYPVHLITAIWPLLVLCAPSDKK